MFTRVFCYSVTSSLCNRYFAEQISNGIVPEVKNMSKLSVIKAPSWLDVRLTVAYEGMVEGFPHTLSTLNTNPVRKRRSIELSGQIKILTRIWHFLHSSSSMWGINFIVQSSIRKEFVHCMFMYVNIPTRQTLSIHNFDFTLWLFSYSLQSNKSAS